MVYQNVEAVRDFKIYLASNVFDVVVFDETCLSGNIMSNSIRIFRKDSCIDTSKKTQDILTGVRRYLQCTRLSRIWSTVDQLFIYTNYL